MMLGKRVYISPAIRFVLLRPGEYAQHHGDWWAVLPNGQFVRLTDHVVEEHPDGTITVAMPVVQGGAFWLWRGVWKVV